MSDKNISHVKWMKRAIFLASLGKNTTSPNPRVGAVIQRKNTEKKRKTKRKKSEKETKEK
jgi:pyrimidine deaminase RibD-like protein